MALYDPSFSNIKRRKEVREPRPADFPLKARKSSVKPLLPVSSNVIARLVSGGNDKPGKVMLSLCRMI
jgi:hypothetical protein